MSKVKINIDGLWHNKKTLAKGTILEADEVLSDLARRKVMADGVVMVEFFDDEKDSENTEEKIAEEKEIKDVGDSVEFFNQSDDEQAIEDENIEQIEEKTKASSTKRRRRRNR